MAASKYRNMALRAAASLRQQHQALMAATRMARGVWRIMAWRSINAHITISEKKRRQK